MPTIHVELFAGRTLEQKRALAKALTDATVQTLGGNASTVDVIFCDVQRHDWATGGTLWSDPVATGATATAPAKSAKLARPSKPAKKK